MNERFRTVLIASATFVAGAAISHLSGPASAAATPLEARVVNLFALAPDALKPNPALPGLMAMPLTTTDGDTVTYQSVTVLPGTNTKHTHATANEFQIVLSGSGTEWVGDKQMPIAPGSFVEIPINTPHAGFTGGPFTLVSIKTPPQAAGDYKPAP